MSVEIKGLQNLLGLNKKITKQEVKRLTAPGENYGSLMLSVNVSVEDGDDLHLVAKMVPPNEYLQEVFNTGVTFRNEIAFYKEIVPILQAFQREHCMDKILNFSPQYYGSRLNLNGSATVDDDAILLLRNIKFDNYVCLDAGLGLDLDQTKLVLFSLAQLHAVSLGFKLKRPGEFHEKIEPYLDTWMVKEKNCERFQAALVRLIAQTEQLQPLKERIVTAFAKQIVPYQPQEPFATVTHNDCWINNILIQFDGATPIDTKIVDYQTCSYGSPARDLLFFLFTSVKSDVIGKEYSELLRWYHQNFTSILEDLNCDTSPFGFEALKLEMESEARKQQFGHVVFMLFVVFAVKKKVEDISKLSGDNLIQTDFTEGLRDKVLFVVEEFGKRGWI